MIDVKELRAGNWVCIEGTTKYNTRISVKDILDLENGEIRNNGIEVLGIPITAKILDMLGFSGSAGGFTFDLNNLSIHMPSVSYPEGRTYFNSWCIIEGIPKNLHSLQNLYFALTNNELNTDILCHKQQ